MKFEPHYQKQENSNVEIWRVNMSNTMYQFLFVVENKIKLAFVVPKDYPISVETSYFILGADMWHYAEAITQKPELIAYCESAKLGTSHPSSIYNMLNPMIEHKPLHENDYHSHYALDKVEVIRQNVTTSQKYTVFMLKYGNKAWDIVLTQGGIIKHYFNYNHDERSEIARANEFTGKEMKQVAADHWHAFRLVSDDFNCDKEDEYYWFHNNWWHAFFRAWFNDSLSDFNKLPEALDIL